MPTHPMKPRACLTRLVTPQADHNPGTRFLARAADAPVWPANEWERFDRFLIFGSERGTYFMRKRTVSLARAANARACVAGDGPRAVRRIVEVSAMGRVVSNAPCLFALAMCVAFGNEATRAMALEAVPEVARAPGEPTRFVEYLASMPGMAAMDHWPAYLRGQADASGLTVIDTTVLTAAEAAAQLEAMVQRLAEFAVP